jgi:radical SAM-linked protein
VADEEAERTPHPAAAAAQRHVVRLSYAKEGPAKYLSGLEIQSLWGRVFRRAGLPLAYSQGFNPSPKLSLSPALAVGAESDVEFLEAEFSLPVPAADVPVKLAPHLPAGIRVTAASGVPPGSPRLSDFDIASDWSLRPLPPFPMPGEVTPGRAEERLAAFRASDRHLLVLTREDRTSEIDLKPIVRTFGVNPDGISITIIQGTGKGVRPLEAAASLLGVPLSPDRFIPRKVSAELFLRRG